MCRYTESTRPALTFGAGLAGSQVLPGLALAGSEFQEPILVPAKVGGVEPIIGVMLHLPLGTGKGSTCDRLIETDRRKAALESARELFDQGLINKKQLEAVAALFYKELLK